MDYAEAAAAQYQSDGLLFVNWVWNAIWLFVRYVGPLQVIALNDLVNGKESSEELWFFQSLRFNFWVFIQALNLKAPYGGLKSRL